MRIALLALWCGLIFLAGERTSQAKGESKVHSGSAATSQPASAPAPGSGVEDIDLLSLEVPVVVTAGRREQKTASVPYAVSVITAEDIRLSGARSVPDALRLAPGVDVAELSINSYAVSIRGLHDELAREVLVLVDGRQVFDSLMGGTWWGNWPLQLEDIARIEVIRGPAGVVWGANAVNGVINIITKDPKDQLGLTVKGGGGSQGWNQEYLGYGFKDQKLRLKVSGEYESSDGFPKGGSILGPPDDDLKTGHSQVKAIYDATPRDTITLSGGNAIVDGGFPISPTAPALTNKKNPGSLGSFLQADWEHRIADDNRIQLNSYVNDFQFSPGTRQLDYRSQQLALQLSHAFSPAENHTLTWGLDGRTDLLDTTNADPAMQRRDFVSTAIIGLYAQDEWRFAPRWSLTLGARIDYEFYGGFQPSGRMALAYDLNETSSIYGAISRAFQMPPVGSRFFSMPLVEGLAFFTSDQDLKPETLIAYELGYRGKFFDRLHTNVNLYCHDYADLTVMDFHLGPPGLARLNFENGYSAVTYGLETDARYVVNSKLSLLAHYTFESMNERGEHSVANTNTLSPPKHKFMVGARFRPVDPLHLTAQVGYVDASSGLDPVLPFLRDSIPYYWRLDLRAEYEFWKDRGSVAVGVRNLLDDNHLEGTSLFQNRAEVPRMVYAEIRLVFK